MSNLKKNLLSVYGVNLINGIAGVAFIPLAIKGLGAEGYGLFSIFTLMTSYIYFVEMGVAKYFTRSIAQSQYENDQIKQVQLSVGIYIRIALILLLLTPILLYLVPNFIFKVESNDSVVEKIVLFAILDYILSIPIAIVMTYNIGTESFIKISKFNLIAGLTRHASLIGSVLIFDSVEIIMIIVLIRRLIELYYGHKYLNSLPSGGWKPIYEKGSFRKVISQSIFLSAAQLMQVTVIGIGTYLVNKNFTLRELGIYKSAFDLSTKVWFFSNGLGLVVFPRFASLLTQRDGKKILLKQLLKFNRLSMIGFNLLFLTIVVLFPVFSDFFYINDRNLFLLLLLGVCLNAHSNLSYEFLQADEKLKELILMNLMVLTCLYVGFYTMRDEFGLYAIPLSWVGTQFCYSIFLDFMVLRTAGFKKSFLAVIFNIIVVLTVSFITWYLISPTFRL